MYSGVPTMEPRRVNMVWAVKTLRGCFGHAEIDDFRDRLAVNFAHQNVGGFQIAVDHRFLMGVLHTFADVNE